MYIYSTHMQKASHCFEAVLIQVPCFFLVPVRIFLEHYKVTFFLQNFVTTQSANGGWAGLDTDDRNGDDCSRRRKNCTALSNKGLIKG